MPVEECVRQIIASHAREKTRTGDDASGQDRSLAEARVPEGRGPDGAAGAQEGSLSGILHGCLLPSQAELLRCLDETIPGVSRQHANSRFVQSGNLCTRVVVTDSSLGRGMPPADLILRERTGICCWNKDVIALVVRRLPLTGRRSSSRRDFVAGAKTCVIASRNRGARWPLLASIAVTGATRLRGFRMLTSDVRHASLTHPVCSYARVVGVHHYWERNVELLASNNLRCF